MIRKQTLAVAVVCFVAWLGSHSTAVGSSVNDSPTSSWPLANPPLNGVKPNGAVVFHLYEAGYFCIKIPYLLSTRNGSILAFAEARKGSCNDYAETDLVMKRSTDNGHTWSTLQLVYSNSTTTVKAVVGNANPIQSSVTGRIMLPFCINNSIPMITYSEDDGLTWSEPKHLPNATRSDWGWIGFGPPGALELHSGRLLIPAYHGPYHWDDGTFTHTHTVYSNDIGDTWQVGFVWDNATDPYFSNECQAAQLDTGRILLNARTLGLLRSQAYSDDNGDTFSPMKSVPSLPQPLDGIEGSLIWHEPTKKLVFANTAEDNILSLRYNMTVKTSSDGGLTYQTFKVLDSGPSGYCALTLRPDNRIGILYEVSNETQLVFLPHRTLYEEVYP